MSTEGQAEQGASLAAQQHRLRAYADAFGINVVAMIEDPGVSAKNLRRPGLTRALAMLDDRRADTLLTCKLDRVTRSIRDLTWLIETHFGDGKASLVSLSESINTTTASGRLVLHVLISIAQWEREAVGERTRDAIAQLQRDGVRIGRPGLGWRYSDRTDDNGHRIIVEVPDERATVERIVALRQQGLSHRRIAAALTAIGERTKRGGRWHAATVARILRRNAA